MKSSSFFDIALPNNERGSLKQWLAKSFKESAMPYRCYFQPMKHEIVGQIADYYAWALFVKLERNEYRPWNALEGSDLIFGNLKDDRPS